MKRRLRTSRSKVTPLIGSWAFPATPWNWRSCWILPRPKEYGIKVLCDEEGNNGLNISSGKGSKTLNVGYIDPPFELQEGEDLTLRIFIDKNMIEVFANDRQAAVAWHDYKPQDLHLH